MLKNSRARLRETMADLSGKAWFPQVLGGELLTSMLTGEKIDVKDIMGRLLGQSDLGSGKAD